MESALLTSVMLPFFSYVISTSSSSASPTNLILHDALHVGVGAII